jgi:hypothetical protein
MAATHLPGTVPMIVVHLQRLGAVADCADVAL